ncbi:hypothetical protein ACHAWU_008074 [Discostella pseudostelligera]|uniref:RING-type domain-containing protein n=1 Tax=Discostella pseudostelligera TaxID=259834 RepID=A0ABD3N810_9STRA
MATPSFSVGTTTSASPAPTRTRRSTRRAAMNATTRIAQELAPQRRSTRLAARSNNIHINNNNNNNSGTLTLSTMPISGGAAAARSANATAIFGGAAVATTELPPVPKAKGSPIVLADDDDGIESLDLKPAAKVPVAELEAAAVVLPVADFTCAICLDTPASLTDAASISGCTHKFCFDCIDKWADTENRCPCCKARFRTIDRVVALPPSPVEIDSPTAAAAKTSGGRKGKRKRSSNSSSSPNSRSRSSASTSTPANRRPNSRTVEDRNQPSMSGIVIDAAFVQNILSTLMNATGGGGAGAAAAAAFGRGGTGQVSFGTAADGRPVIRIVNPQAGGMVRVMEMYLSDGAQLATGGVGSATVSGTTRMTVRVRSRTPTSNDSRGVAGSGGSSSSPPPPRVMRPVTTELLQQMMGGGSAASGSAATAAAATSAAAASARPAARAASTFASLFGRGDNTGATSSSPRGRRVAFSVGGSNTAGAAGAPSATTQMTIQIVSRPSNASRSTNHSPTARSSNRRASNGGSTDNEPIVID